MIPCIIGWRAVPSCSRNGTKAVPVTLSGIYLIWAAMISSIAACGLGWILHLPKGREPNQESLVSERSTLLWHGKGMRT
jgi:hypothetical protein